MKIDHVFVKLFELVIKTLPIQRTLNLGKEKNLFEIY